MSTKNLGRRKFLATVSGLGATAFINPSPLMAQSWILEILEKLVEMIIVDVFVKPIETVLRDVLNLPDVADEVKKKNDQYAQENAYVKDTTYQVGSSSVFYAVSSKQNINRAGQLIVPFWDFKDNQHYKHVGDFGKHETETVSRAASYLHLEKGVSKELNTKLVLPSKLLARTQISGGMKTEYLNREEGKVTLCAYPFSKLTTLTIQSNSYSKTRPTTLAQFPLTS